MLRIIISCMVIVGFLFVALPSVALADDGEKKSNWYWCTSSWPNEKSDGFTAADHRFEYMNPWSEWPVRTPVEIRTSAGDNRFVIYSYIPLKVDYGEPIEIYKPAEVIYDAPPQLDKIQQVRWYQALPWSKCYLAKIWGVSKEIAREYGAKYD